MPEKPAASVRRARVATWSQVVARVMTSNSMLSSPYGAAGVRDAPLPAALPLSPRAQRGAFADTERSLAALGMTMGVVTGIRESACHARRSVRDIIEGQGHRNAG